MKKTIIAAVLAVFAFIAVAEEKFDVVFDAASGKNVKESGFGVFGYQTANPSAPGYLGVQNGVLVMEHNHPALKFNNCFIDGIARDWNSLTADFRIRMAGNTDKVQFQLSGVFKSEKMSSKVATFFVNFSKSQINLAGAKIPFNFGDGFRSFRVVASIDNNKCRLYDMDNGGKLIFERDLSNGTPQHKKMCSFRFGDGAAAVEGKAELEYMKFAFDQTYVPAQEYIFDAESGKSLNDSGIKNFSYQTKNPSAPGYLGVQNGVLVMEHNDQKNKWNNCYVFDKLADWQSLSIDFKIRLVGNTHKPQFRISGVLKDVNRPHNVSTFVANFSKNVIDLTGKKAFALGNDFHSFRLIVDKASNKYYLYDMDNNGVLISEGNLQNGVSQHQSCIVRFGDGGVDVEGKVELKYFKLYIDQILKP